MKTSLKIAWRFIIKSPMQSLLMILTITLGIGSQLFIVTLSSSVTNLTNDIVLATNEHVYIDSSRNNFKNLTDEDVELIKTHENTKYVSLHKQASYLVEKDELPLLDLNITKIEEEMLNIIDVKNNLVLGVPPIVDSNEIMVSTHYINENNLKLNDTITIISPTSTIDYLITGIYERPAYNPSSNYFGYIVESDLSPTNSIYITLNNIEEMDEYLEFLNEHFKAPNRIFDYANRYQAQVLINQAQLVGLFVIQIFITIAIILVASSIFNYFVSRKTSQLGILKALGYNQKQITRTLSLLTFILGFVSSLLGIIISKIGLDIFQRIMTYEDGTLRIKITTNIWLYALSVFLVYIAIWFSTYTTLRKTKKKQIVELIKNET